MARTRRPTSSTISRVADSATISEATVIGASDSELKPLETPPLLLMPMRLEYRVVHKQSSDQLVDRTAENLAFEKGRSPKTERSTRQSEAARRAARSAIMTQPFEVKSLNLNGKTEIWFRWYPDDAFSEKSIQAITEDEAKLLATYRASLGALAWWNTEDARAVELWQAFAGAVGPYRALHLIRTGGAGTPPVHENRMGRIAALPLRVKLFAVTGEIVSIVGQGKEIPHNGQTLSEVNYSPQAIDMGGWLTDFSKAIELGMGTRITDEQNVEDALKADWIIAVGIYTKDARIEIETLLKDRIATGEFEILPQDAPTNNSPGEQSILTNPRNDLTDFLRVAAQDENGAIDAAVGDYGAGLLAEILGIDPQPLRKAVRAADGAFEDARAMLRVIGPALLDDSPNEISLLEGISENDFVEVMAASISARGALPPIRSGRNAYGIATMAEIIEDPPGPEPPLKRDRVQRLLRVFCGIWRQYAPSHADGVVPRIEPDDSEAATKLEEILKINRVSTRIDVAKGRSGNTKPIGCPYVSGRKPEHRPQAYLKRLRHTGLDNLPDPTSDDLDWPLLYRLARMSLTVNSTLQVARSVLGPRSKSLGYLEHIPASDKQQLKPATDKLGSYSSEMLSELKPGDLTLVGVETIELIRVINANFSDSLVRLQSIAQRENGRAQLGTLMREVFDLFQHRIDAWATGLALERIRNNRRAGQTGLNAGYYGFVGKLRQESATGSGNGFLLAPSPMQATAAAVLRSSYLRHRGNGAFKIDLRSVRSRNGLSILDLLMKGLSLNEALGLRGERWLHDHKLSRLTLDLRRQFPISNLSPPEKEKPKPSGQRVFDGLAFLARKVRGTDELHLQKLKAFIDDDLDSLSDIVVAEAVYQRSMGAGEVANAWLQVLSGEPVPGSPQFLRTHRQGQASTYRVTYILEEEPIPPDPAPRVIAEPALARFCRDILENFSQVVINVRVSIVGGAANVLTIPLGLERDLGMDPIDLVVGGESELLLRSRYELIQRWLTHPAIVERLGQLSGTGMDAFLASKFKIEFDLGVGETRVESLLETATIIRKSVQNSRPLEPSDLNAAASPEHILDEATEMRIIQSAMGKLRVRAEAMRRRLATDKESFGAARRGFVKSVDEYLDARRSGLEQRVIDGRINETRVRRQALATELRVVSRWAEPSALRSFTLEEVFADVSSLDARLEQLEQRLEKRLHGLSQAIAGTAGSNYSTLSDARLGRDHLIESIKKALDGDALPILPPYVIEAATKAEVQAGQNIGGSLGSWATVRSRVSDALKLAIRDKSAKGFAVTPVATRDDSETADPRSEAVAPRSYHHAVFVAGRTPATVGRTVVGMVLDEWSQQRPSAKQTAGIAINYDSPQAQSPHCLLLCVPREVETRSWLHATAAKLVWEAIQWMKIRALSTSDRPTPAALLPNGNQIAFKKTGSRTVSRIPEQAGTLLAQPWVAEGHFELHTGNGKKSDLAREATRFHKVKE